MKKIPERHINKKSFYGDKMKISMPTERTSQRGLAKPLTASWDATENVGKIKDLLNNNLPDGVLIENITILRQLGQLPEHTPAK